MSFASMSVGGSDCDSVSVPVPDAPNPASVSVPNAPSPMPASVVQEQLQLGVTMEIRVLRPNHACRHKAHAFQDSVPPPRAPPSAYLTGPPPGPPPEEKSQIIYQQPKVCFRPTSFDRQVLTSGSLESRPCL
jgi:hypothetical protein